MDHLELCVRREEGEKLKVFLGDQVKTTLLNKLATYLKCKKEDFLSLNEINYTVNGKEITAHFIIDIKLIEPVGDTSKVVDVVKVGGMTCTCGLDRNVTVTSGAFTREIKEDLALVFWNAIQGSTGHLLQLNTAE